MGQKFYLKALDKWVTAQDLMQSPELQAQFPEAILEIRQVNQSIEIYKLTVAHEHNFYVTEKQLLVHNFIPMVTVVGIAIPSIVIPIAKGAGTAAFAWLASKFLKSLSPVKKGHDAEWQKYREQYVKAKHGNSNADQKQGESTKKDKGSNNAGAPGGAGGPNGPNDPNWPPKKNGNNNKKPDNDDKKKDDKDKRDKKEDKKNEEKRKDNDAELKKSENSEKDSKLSESELQNPKDIAKHVEKNEQAILDAIEPALEELAKNGRAFQQIRPRAFRLKHMFSENHIKDGLMKLGKNINTISQKIIEVVGNADKLKDFKQGINPIQTYINELPVEIHVYLENKTIVSISAFIGHSVRASISNNLIRI